MKTKLRPGWVLALLCTVLFFYGFYLGGVQLVISEVSREYGQNAAGMGGLVAAQHVAAVVLPVVLGALADRIGKKPVLCIFAAVFAAGCFLAGLSKKSRRVCDWRGLRRRGLQRVRKRIVRRFIRAGRGEGRALYQSVTGAALARRGDQPVSGAVAAEKPPCKLAAAVFDLCGSLYAAGAAASAHGVPETADRHAKREAKARTNFFSPRARSGCCFSQSCCMSGWKTASATLPRACSPCVCRRAILQPLRSRPIGSA